MSSEADSQALASALPAHLRRRLEKRANTIGRGGALVRDSSKENSDGTNEARKQEAEAAPEKAVAEKAATEKAATESSQRRDSLPKHVMASPSRCVVEAERMKLRRQERRQVQERRREQKDEDEPQQFQRMIAAYRSAQKQRGAEGARAAHSAEPADLHARLRVCVRKRPILPAEAADGEFDVLSCSARTAGEG